MNTVLKPQQTPEDQNVSSVEAEPEVQKRGSWQAIEVSEAKELGGFTESKCLIESLESGDLRSLSQGYAQ